MRRTKPSEAEDTDRLRLQSPYGLQLGGLGEIGWGRGWEGRKGEKEEVREEERRGRGKESGSQARSMRLSTDGDWSTHGEMD